MNNNQSLMKQPLQTWLKGKSLTVAKQSLPSETGFTGKEVEKQLANREFRLGNLIDKLKKNNLSKPILIATAFSIGGLASMSTYASDFSDMPVDRDQAHQEIRQEVSPGWDHLQRFGGSSDITIVDMDDPHLKQIIDATALELLPESKKPGAFKKMFSVLNSDEEIKRDSTLDHIKEKSKSPVSLGTIDTSKLGKLCFIQDDLSHDTYLYGANADTPVSFADIELKMGIRSHETAHCLDNDSSSFTNATLKKEILADATSMLYMASQTGNWDYLDYSLETMRSLTTSYDHSTLDFLKAIQDNVSLDDLSPMTQQDAFEMAQTEVRKLSFYDIQKTNVLNQKYAEDYNNYLKGDLTWDSFEWDQADAYIEQGINSPEQFNQFMAEYGQQRIQDYLDHVSYKSLESNTTFAEAVIHKLKVYGDTFDNAEFQESAEQQAQILKSAGAINIADITEKTGLTVNFEPKERFQENMQSIQSIYEQTSPSLSTQASNLDGDHSTEFAVNKDATSSFLDRMGLQSPGVGAVHTLSFGVS